MKHPLKYVLVLALAGSVSLAACSDDSSSSDEEIGGSAGASGSKTGGSSAGGSASSGGEGGSSTAGTSATAGAGGATDGGTGGAVDTGAGGSAGDGGGSDAGGAGGAGAGLVYACGSDNLWQKTCSAWVAAECPDATVCSDCVTALTADREGFTDPACAACDDKYEAFYQCQVDAFESGNLAFGVECLEGLGAVETENCFPLLDEAIMCQGYVGSDQDPKPCPATWPPQ
ncbi:MAG TPA: hypothetical protein VHP33_11220 [Polyangiaceae bacterium]|nr:hypothetical protein [Polyangiaceae bacterium]